MLMEEKGDILTKYFHIWTHNKKLICVFEIYLNGKYILLEYKNHKLNNKEIWII